MELPRRSGAAALGTIVAARQPLAEVLEQVGLVESLGFDSVWIPEIAGRDAIVTCALLAARTARIRVGTGVVPLPVRSPVLLAMGAATVAEASQGRFVLGVGIGHQETVGPWYGTGAPHRLAQVEEDLAIVRALLADGKVRRGDRDAIEVRLRGVHHTAPPPLLLAALAPGLARLAARHADGMLLNWVTVERAAELVTEFRAEAERLGRDPEELTVGCYVPVSVTDDVEAAQLSLATQIAAYGRLEAYRRSLYRCGLGADVDRVLAAPRDSRAGAVSERLLAGLGAIGPAAYVERRLGEFRAAGVTLPILAPLALPGGQGWASMVETWSALAPSAP